MLDVLDVEGDEEDGVEEVGAASHQVGDEPAGGHQQRRDARAVVGDAARVPIRVVVGGDNEDAVGVGSPPPAVEARHHVLSAHRRRNRLVAGRHFALKVVQFQWNGHLELAGFRKFVSGTWNLVPFLNTTKTAFYWKRKRFLFTTNTLKILYIGENR